MKTLLIILAILVGNKSGFTQLLKKGQINLYTGPTWNTPKKAFTVYKGTIDAEVGIGFELPAIKYTNALKAKIEVLHNRRRFRVENNNIILPDVDVNCRDFDIRIFPFVTNYKTVKVSRFVSAIGSAFYVDLGYTSAKYVQINIPNDIKRTMPNFGWGLHFAIEKYKLPILVNFCSRYYEWTNASGTRSAIWGNGLTLGLGI